MMRCWWTALAFSALLIAGCADTGGAGSAARPQTPTAPARPAGNSESLLRYYEHLRNLPAADLSKEYEAVRELYAKSSADAVTRMRYAMLLGIPGTAFNADGRALEVLDPLLKSADTGLHALAFMLSTQIQEQRRGHGLQQRLDASQRNLDASQKNLEASQKNLEASQQKLDALRSLEKSLIERDTGGAKRR